MRNVLLFSFSLMALYACDPITERLILINNTEGSFYYLLGEDTIPYLHRQLRLSNPYDTVKPNFVTGIRNYMGWEHKINRECIDSALHIFILSTNQITADMREVPNSKHTVHVIGKPNNWEYAWITDETIKNKNYERLSFTVKELDSLNWTVVVYRGQSEMAEDED